MKKKKEQAQGPGDLTNMPFKAMLKGFTPKAAASPEKKPLPPPAPADTIDDEALFLRSMGGVKKLGDPLPAPAPAGTPVHPPVTAAIDSDQEREEFLRALGTIAAPAFREQLPQEEEIDPEPARSLSNRMRRLKKGAIRISGELDLHGMIRDEALRRLSGFISNARVHGQEAVLVITGKGLNSPEGPVLQGAVSAWLRDQGRTMVVEFAPAPRDKGGSGAFVVFLRT